jgi:hypothetical protein
MIFVGVDPGITGAIVSLSGDGKLITVSDFKQDASKRLDVHHIRNVMEAIVCYHQEADFITCLEKSQSMPGQGSVSIFNYGVTYGILFSSLSLIKNNKIVEVSPKKWKKEFDLNSDKKKGIIRTKEDSVNVAVQLFPSREELFRRPKKKEGFVLMHGRAEAMLIAEFCRRQYGNNKT